MDKEARELGESNVHILLENERKRRQYRQTTGVTQVILTKLDNIVTACVTSILDPIRASWLLGLSFSCLSGYLMLWDLTSLCTFVLTSSLLSLVGYNFCFVVIPAELQPIMVSHLST